MTETLDWGDDLGPAKIIRIFESRSDLKGVLVVDNVACGPAIGGLRMAVDVTTPECIRLARAMTLKNAAAGLPHGGGKSVLYGDPRAPRERKQQQIRAFAHALRNETDYIFGPDMGTDETCMGWIKDEIGRAVGLPAVLGGIPLDDLGATAWGLLHCAEAAVPYTGVTVNGARVAIQGFGAVGKHSARFFARRGAKLIALSDSTGTIANPAGLDAEALARFKDGGGRLCDYPEGERLGRDAVVGIECDIWIPAARPDVVSEDNVDSMRTRVVLQGANIAFTPGAEQVLAAKGITIVPDFIANAGGVICAAMEYAGATRAAAFAAIAERVQANTEAVLSEAKSSGALPRQAAEALAVRRVRQAMGFRRYSTL
jgi:glutamate dehydrogenase (NAD(P)+)